MRIRIRSALVAAVAVGAGAAALVVASLRSPAPAGPSEPATVRTASTAAGTAPLPAVPSAQPPDLAGARDAALRYLGLAEQVVAMTEAEALVAQRDAATDAAGPSLVEDLRRRLAALRTAFPAGGLRYRVAPLAARAQATGPGRARVEICYVGVVSAPAVAPYEEWRLSRYDLVWERGAWRVAAESSGPGPRPASPPGPPPATAAELESSLAGFTSVAGRP